MHAHARNRPFRDVPEVVVVGQVDHLPQPRHLAEHPQCLLGPEVVKGLHDIIRDERHRRPGPGELAVAGGTQRQVQLKPRSLREVGVTCPRRSGPPDMRGPEALVLPPT